MGIGRSTSAAVAVEGTAALAAGIVAGWWLPNYTAAAAAFSVLGAGARPQLALLTLAMCAAAVMVAPLLARPLGRAGGWVVATVGLLLLALGYRPLAVADVGRFGRTSLLVAASGLVLGAVLAALAAGRRANRLATALGLAVGLPVSPAVLSLAWSGGRDGEPSWQLVAVVAAAVTAAAAILTATRRRADTAGAPVPPSEPAPPSGEDTFAAVWPALAVAAVAGGVLLADAVRMAVTEAIAVSPDGFASPRRAQAVTLIDWVVRVGVILAVGALLAWCGYARGRGAAGRWVWTGVGLMVLLSPTAQRVTVLGPGRTWLLVGLVAVAAGAGVLAARLADRAAPWDAVGLLLVAAGLVLAVRALDQELISGPPLHPYLIGAGLALALGAGLGRMTSWPDRARPAYARATDAGLGLAAALLAGGVIAPLLLPIAYGQRIGPHVAWQPPALVALAAVIVVLFFGLARAVDRVRRDIRAEAAEPAGADASQ